MEINAQTVPPMTSRQRVLAALRREPVDRTPVCNPTSVATVELMDLVDAPFPDANRVPELMARLAATSYTELGFDSIMPVFSIIQESSALGCKIQWEQKDNWPTVKMREPIWQHPELRGWLGNLFSDSNQLDFYWQLARFLDAEGWDDVRARPGWSDVAQKAAAPYG